MLLMSSTERLTNSTMCLVGLMALHTEHLVMAKLQREKEAVTVSLIEITL